MREKLKALLTILGIIALIAIIIFWFLFEFDLLAEGGIFWFIGLIAAIIVEVFLDGTSTDHSSENTKDSETQKETKIQDKKEYKEPWEK